MDTKELIVDRSTDMFIEHGVKSIRMDDIAAGLGISKRTIYEIFGDRQSLIMDCMECYLKRREANNKKLVADAQNVIEEFIILIDNWEEVFQENIKFMEDLQKFYPKLFDQVALRRHDEGVYDFKLKLQQGIDKGIFMDSINIDFAAELFTGSIYNIVGKHRSGVESEVSISQAFKYVITYFFRGISTTKGMEIIDKYIK